MKRKFLLVVPLIATLTGCTHVVEVIEPPDAKLVDGGYTFGGQPKDKIVVKIGGNYVDKFSVDLDGTDITNKFSPAAAPNTNVTANINGCYSGGTVISGGNGRHAHEIIARANSSVGGFKIDNDISHIVPPLVRFNPAQGSVHIPVGQTMTIQMNLTDGPTSAVPVTLDPDSTDISLNGATNGATVTTSIPNNNVATFTIRGVAPGNFTIAVKAKGVECASLGGKVMSR